MRVIFVAMFVTAGSIALAHSGATGIVKERMDGMGSLAASMKSLVGMHKTGAIDADSVRQIARTIKAHSGSALNARFPDGSLPKVSEASPKIWEDWDRFSEISGELFAVASRLETEATTPDLNLGGYVEELGATCSSCHKDFRIKK
ncbi:MAG: cytochrome c [Pseudomonadota bacterium]